MAGRAPTDDTRSRLERWLPHPWLTLALVLLWTLLLNSFSVGGLLMGVVLGVLVTLSSVGAGAFGVMALVLLFPNLPMIRIIGSDVAHAVLLTLVAGLGHLKAGNVDTHLLLLLLTGSIPAIIAGTLLSSRLPEHGIRRVLGVTLLLLGLNFILNPVKAKPKEPAPVPATPPAALVHSRQP